MGAGPNSEDPLPALSVAHPNLFWFASPDGSVHFFNTAWLAYTGRPPLEALAEGWVAAIHPNDRFHVERWEAALQKGELFEADLRLIDAAGEGRWHEVKLIPLRNASGTVVEWFGSAADIHEPQSVREALQRLGVALAAQRDADEGPDLDLSRDAFVITDKAGVWRAVSPLLAATLGYEVHHLLGRTSEWLEPPADWQRTRSEFDSLAKGRITTRFESRLRGSDGRYRWFAWVAVPHGDRRFCVAQNITIQKAAAERLRVAESQRQEADALYRAVFENAADPLFVVRVEPSGDFVVEQTNPAHKNLTGLSDVVGRRLEDLLPPQTSAKVLARYREAVAEGQPIAWRDVYELEVGVVQWDTKIVPVRGADGRISRIVGSGRDVTPPSATAPID